jgi:Resolvase, N terminal domain
MLDRIAGNGVRVVLVESPDRFARDLAVQLTGHDYLRSLGVELVPTSAPDFFTTDTPTAVLVRQVLGAISRFEKANLVAKLRAARERKIAAGGRGSGRFAYARKVPEVVTLGARATWAAPVAAADSEDARRARSPHWRRQAVHGDGGAEDAARRIGTADPGNGQGRQARSSDGLRVLRCPNMPHTATLCLRFRCWPVILASGGLLATAPLL